MRARDTTTRLRRAHRARSAGRRTGSSRGKRGAPGDAPPAPVLIDGAAAAAQTERRDSSSSRESAIASATKRSAGIGGKRTGAVAEHLARARVGRRHDGHTLGHRKASILVGIRCSGPLLAFRRLTTRSSTGLSSSLPGLNVPRTGQMRAHKKDPSEFPCFHGSTCSQSGWLAVTRGLNRQAAVFCENEWAKTVLCLRPGPTIVAERITP